MSILNHSILPNFPTKGSGSQDACQHLPTPSFQEEHTLNPFQPSLSKCTPLIIASGESKSSKMSDPQKERFKNVTFEGSINGIDRLSPLLSDDLVHKTTHNVDFKPIALSLLCPQENRTRVQNSMVELDRNFSSEPNVAVLSVAVSSAVKLEDTQIDQITRKMQRLTGFRHLRLENVVDPSLIAGFIIRYGSDVIDLSVKGQLAALAARVESSDKRIANSGKSWSFSNIMEC